MGGRASNELSILVLINVDSWYLNYLMSRTPTAAPSLLALPSVTHEDEDNYEIAGHNCKPFPLAKYFME